MYFFGMKPHHFLSKSQAGLFSFHPRIAVRLHCHSTTLRSLGDAGMDGLVERLPFGKFLGVGRPA